MQRWFFRRRICGVCLAVCLACMLHYLVLSPIPALAAQTEQPLSLYAFASAIDISPNEPFSYTVAVLSRSKRAVTVRVPLDKALVVGEIATDLGMTCTATNNFVCRGVPKRAMTLITVHVKPKRGSFSSLPLYAQASASDGATNVWSNRVAVQVSSKTQTQQPSVARTSIVPQAQSAQVRSVAQQESTPTPIIPIPTPTPSVDENTPCLKAAMAAVTRQGAIYSQGGALADDPINPATGQPYPRTGPNSFDCSGLIWWAYHQAGVSIGTSTSSQVSNGTAISCTLANLRGSATTCWAPGDLIFLRYGGSSAGPGSGSGQHVAIYVGNGLFMDCYNHTVGCIMHDVSRDSFYQRHFWQARRIVGGCEGMTTDPGVPIAGPIGEPADDMLCVPDPPAWRDEAGVSYSRGCGPPVLLPNAERQTGTHMRQFVGAVGWLGQTGAISPQGSAGVHLHLGLDIGTMTDMCRWPLQAVNVAEGEPPPGAYFCTTTWADPLQFLPQANPNTLAMVDGTPEPVVSGEGDPTLSDSLVQLPPPGHPATNLLPPANPEKPDGTWWSPGNDDRANKVNGALGGPAIVDWLGWLWCTLFGWLPWSNCQT